MLWTSAIVNAYKIVHMQHRTEKTNCKANQDSKSAREELAAWKVEINWNNCLLQQWICYRHHTYSQQNYFAGSIS